MDLSNNKKDSAVKVRVIIPAMNEEKSIARVIEDIPAEWVAEVIVVDNGSVDQTVRMAKAAGATVLTEKLVGYGAACLRGMAYLNNLVASTDIVVFLDGDYSDHPEEMPQLLAPILNHEADLVIGSRALGKRERGALTPVQLWGNWLASRLLKLFYGVKFTDLGPFRAISFASLKQLGMKDKNYGWTVEMQLKAAKKGIRCTEIPVSYRRRIGFSKVSGTVKGTILAGYKILFTIFRYV